MNTSKLAGGENTPTKEPPTGKAQIQQDGRNTNGRKDNPRASRQGNQRDVPLSPTEPLPQKFTLPRQLAKQSIWNHKQTKRVTKNGETKKETTIKKDGWLPSKRAKLNGGKRTIRYRIWKNGDKYAQGLTDNYKELSTNYNSVKKKTETINKNQE